MQSGVKRLFVDDVICFLSDSNEYEYTLQTKKPVIDNPVIVVTSPANIVPPPEGFLFMLQPTNPSLPCIELSSDCNNILGRSSDSKWCITNPRISMEHIGMAIHEKEEKPVVMKQLGEEASSVNGVLVSNTDLCCTELAINDVIRFLSYDAATEYTIKLVLNTTNPPVIVDAPAPAPIIAVAIPIRHQIPTGVLAAVQMMRHPGDRRHPPTELGGWGGSRTKNGFKSERSSCFDEILLYGQSLPCSSNKICSLRNNINAANLLSSNTVVTYPHSDALINGALTIKKMFPAKQSGPSIVHEARKGLIIVNNLGAITLQHTDMLAYETRVCYAVKDLGVLGPQDLLTNCLCIAFALASGNTQCSISQGRNVVHDSDKKNHCKHTVVLTAVHFFSDDELRRFLA